jgi:hypothetical protein
MTTKAFLRNFNETVTVEGQNLLVDFFIVFSRFECALKASHFSNGEGGKVMANWDTFIADIRPNFDKGISIELNQAVDYLIQHPPRVQTLEHGQLAWKNRVFQDNEHEINKLNLSIRDIRNNLFHGGKFNGRYQPDISRNFTLLKNSIIILNSWLELNQQVKNNFLQPIE